MNGETAAVIDWVVSDRSVSERCRSILARKDSFAGRRASAVWGNCQGWEDVPSPVAAMADFIENVIRWDGGPYSAPSAVRDLLGPGAWYEVEWGKVLHRDAVDWTEVRDALERQA